MDYTIFSVDHHSDLYTLSKFLRYLDNKRAMGNLKFDPIVCIGCYKGELENSFIMHTDDFQSYIFESGFVDNQETFLYVGAQKQMPFWLKDQDGHTIQSGRMKTYGSMPSTDGWTYRPDVNLYWAFEEK